MFSEVRSHIQSERRGIGGSLGMVKQKHEMTDEELYHEFRKGGPGSPGYDKYFTEMQIRQMKAQIESAKATKRSALWMFITMVIIGVTNAALIYLQIQQAAGQG